MKFMGEKRTTTNKMEQVLADYFLGEQPKNLIHQDVTEKMMLGLGPTTPQILKDPSR